MHFQTEMRCIGGMQTLSTNAAAFETRHSVVPVLCFSAILGLTMCAAHPVITTLSLACALVTSAYMRGVAPTFASLRWQLPLLALVCLANPLFSASGSTLVAKLGPVAIYAESLAYGACMGALVVAVAVWCAIAACVLSQDRLLALAARKARSVPLVASLTAQLMPQLVRRGEQVRQAREATTAAGTAPSLLQRLTTTSGVLLSWALEDSIERADAMRARGWESGERRTSWQRERFSARDALAVAGILALTCLCALLAWVACSQWRFYPTMPRLVAWWGYLPMAVLFLLPAGSELAGRVREWRVACLSR